MNPAPVGLLAKPQDLPGQFLPPAVDARLDGPFREAQPLGDLKIRQFLDIAKQNRDPERLGQRLQRLPQQRGEVAVLERRQWAGLGGDRREILGVTSRSMVWRSLRTLR